jgi:pimeloyl-ACP methyl ester carboxylesterase
MFANINGIQLYYEIHGDGEPVVLLHGFSGSGITWGKIGYELSKKFKVIIPDLRGHGKSTDNLKHYTFKQVALDIFALLDQLGIANFKSIGCSGGGNALLHMATLQPKRIESLVLVSATTHYPKQAREIMKSTTVNTLTNEEWEYMRKLHVRGDEQIKQLYEYARSFSEDDTDMNFDKKSLSKISAKTLIVQGDKDLLYPVELSVEMFRSIPNSSLWIIPDGGHVPLNADTTDEFIDKIIKFLSQ